MKRYSEAQRTRIVSEFESGSIGNAAEFCRRRRISRGSLARWQRWHGAAQCAAVTTPSVRAAGPDRWVPVVLETATLRGGLAQPYVVSVGSARLEVPRGFDGQEVRELCAVLRGLSPLEAGSAA
jgi:hypothetical protein